MFIAILTLLSALSISAIAAFYSIVGLATIFPGAYWAVIAMGTALEAGKLVCASWLYRNWHVTNRALRTYLFSSVIVLCLITSMGIFGFLSKAHLETNFQSSSNSQQIAIINSQIKSEQDVIERQTEIIKRNSGASGGSGERVAQLKDRLKQLDREVEAYTSQGATSTIFNDKVAKGIELKNSQKAERDRIDAEIRQLTSSNQGNNTNAEAQIARGQQRIQQLISQRAPLQSQQIKIDAEIGPIKYIGALAVDVGLAQQVDVEAAVRWVIVIIIFVFDPLAVLMLVAANQSFTQRFPTLTIKPREIIDLEKPDLDAPPAYKNNVVEEIKKKYETQLKEWQEKLARFNEKAPAPVAKDMEIVPVPAKENGTNDTASYVIKDAIDAQPAIAQSEKKRLEQEITQDNYLKKETLRIRPDLTEVVGPEHSERVGILGRVLVRKNKTVVGETKALSIDPINSKRLLQLYHSQHGRFQDASDLELKNERDDFNRQAFLAAYPVTADDSRDHPPITASRRAFFQDYVDDVLRGNTTASNLPPDVARTVAIILSQHPDPAIAAKEAANTAVEQTGLTTMTTAELKQHFGIEPPTEDRDMTNDELDALLGDTEGKDSKQNYVQNEEQQESNQWSRILEIKEPDKNEIILPNLPSTPEADIPDLAETMAIDATIPSDRINRHRNKMLSDDEYRRRIEDRINDLITKIEQGAVKLTDLTQEDQQVIMEIMNTNG